jgi:hypothetical protein
MKGPAAIALTALLSSTVIFPASASELAQPSPINNVLYLHYNMTYHQGWMNVNISDDGDDGWSYYGGIFGFTEPIYLRFIMKPGLNGSVCLITDPARNWTVHVGHYEGYGKIRDVKGALMVGDHYCQTAPESGDSFDFTFVPGIATLTSSTAIIFNLSFVGQGGDFVPNDLHILTGGNSTLAVPIVAVDSDGDGHDDTRDAYPLDPTRWQKPKPVAARGFLPGFDALAMVVALGILAASFTRRERRLQRFR